MQIQEFSSKEIWIEQVADYIEKKCQEEISRKSYAMIVLAGGNTPKPVYERLSKSTLIDWSKVFFFFGDERLVPHDHPESNYRTAHETFLKHITAGKVYSIPTHLPYEACATAYEKEIQDFLEDTGTKRFDLVLLGLGPDGHTASLFPHSPALDETTQWVATSETKVFAIEKRITLTYPALLSAEEIMVLSTGDEKKQLVRKLDQESDFHQFPIKKILAEGKKVTVFTD